MIERGQAGSSCEGQLWPSSDPQVFLPMQSKLHRPAPISPCSGTTALAALFALMLLPLLLFPPLPATLAKASLVVAAQSVASSQSRMDRMRLSWLNIRPEPEFHLLEWERNLARRQRQAPDDLFQAPSEKNTASGGQSEAENKNGRGYGSSQETMQTKTSNESSSKIETLAVSGATTSTQLQQRQTNESLYGSETNYDDIVIGTLTIINIIICCIGMTGNLVVITVILKYTRTNSVTDIYILNLALADLTFVTGLIFLVSTMFLGYWIFGNIMCKFFMAATSLNQFASSLLLVVMSFDRYLAVCHPIYAQQFRQPKRAKFICLCIWIICLILMVPILTFSRTNEELTCGIYWPEYQSINCEKAFSVYAFTIGFLAPLLLIAAFYFLVVRKLRLAAAGQINVNSTRRSRSRETTNRRIENLVILIICTYTVCWLPYWITQIRVAFSGTQTPEFYTFILVGTSLSYTNSALNPILYAFLSDNFKRRCFEAFQSIKLLSFLPRLLLCKGCHKQQLGRSGSGSSATTAGAIPIWLANEAQGQANTTTIITLQPGAGLEGDEDEQEEEEQELEACEEFEDELASCDSRRPEIGLGSGGELKRIVAFQESSVVILATNQTACDLTNLTNLTNSNKHASQEPKRKSYQDQEELKLQGSGAKSQCQEV